MAIDTRITYQNEYDRIGRMAELLKIGTRVRVITTENRNLLLRAGTVIGKAGLDEYDVRMDDYKGYTSDGVFRFSSHQIEILDTDSRYPMSITCDNRNFYKEIVNTFYGRINSKEETMKKVNYAVKKIIYNPPATIVFWEDGSKTVVKCSQYDEYDPYFGFLAALAKKVYGNPSRVRKIVDKWAPEDKEQYYKFTIVIKFANAPVTDANILETSKNTIGKHLRVCSDTLTIVSIDSGEIAIVAESLKPITYRERLFIQYAVETNLTEFCAISDVRIAACPMEKKDDKE